MAAMRTLQRAHTHLEVILQREEERVYATPKKRRPRLGLQPMLT